MVKKKFEKLQKKYNLPSWDELNHEFELFSIEEEDFLLRSINKQLELRLDMFLNLMEGILSPDGGDISDVYESRCFSEEDKTEFFEIFKKLKFFKVLFFDANFSRDEKREAQAINDFFSAWSDLKLKIEPVIQALQSCWLKEDETKERTDYLG